MHVIWKFLTFFYCLKYSYQSFSLLSNIIATYFQFVLFIVVYNKLLLYYYQELLYESINERQRDLPNTMILFRSAKISLHLNGLKIIVEKLQPAPHTKKNRRISLIKPLNFLSSGFLFFLLYLFFLYAMDYRLKLHFLLFFFGGKTTNKTL